MLNGLCLGQGQPLEVMLHKYHRKEEITFLVFVMTYYNKLYTQDIEITDCLTFCYNSGRSNQSLNNKNIIFLAGFSGSGKSTLIKRLSENLENYFVIPERRVITGKCMIEPMVSLLKLKGDFNTRDKRIEIVSQYKKIIPEGIVFVLKHINFTGTAIPEGFLFDGIRGDFEIAGVLKEFKNAKIILLDTSENTRKERLDKRKDPHDNVQGKAILDASKIINDDIILHGKNKVYKNKRVLTINTDLLNRDEVYNTSINWITDYKI